MGNLYAIQGNNEVALFKANYKQIQQYLTQDSNWASRLAEINNNHGLVVSSIKFNQAISGSNIIEEGQNYFVARGSQNLFYRIEAVDANTSRITPEGRIWGYLKFAIPFGLFMSCVIPVLLTPVIFSLRKKAAKSQSQYYLNAFCKYLEIRQQNIQNQIRQGDIKQ